METAKCIHPLSELGENCDLSTCEGTVAEVLFCLSHLGIYQIESE